MTFLSQSRFHFCTSATPILPDGVELLCSGIAMKTKLLVPILFFSLTIALAACVPMSPDGLTAGQQTAIAGTVTAVIEQERTQTFLTGTPLLPTQTATLAATSTVATATPKNTPTATIAPPSQDVIGPDTYPEGVNPLTGLKVPDPAILRRRPVIMKVSNHLIDYQAHWGLSSADIVFDYYIGWGSDRYAALYYGQDASKIGPIRSIRRVDGHLGSLYQAVIGATGGDKEDVLPYIDAYISPGRYFLDKYLCPGVCDDGRNYVYSVFGDSAALYNYFNYLGYGKDDPDLSGMAFSEAAPSGGEEGSGVWIIWTDVGKAHWIYNPDTSKYHNWTIDESTYYTYQSLIDQNTGEQLSFSNVIVLKAPYTEIKGTLHSIDLIGNSSGYEATIFRDGMAYEVFWKTPQSDKPIQFVDTQGNPFPLKPGNTWIAIFGLTSPTVVESGDWSITFNMP